MTSHSASSIRDSGHSAGGAWLMDGVLRAMLEADPHLSIVLFDRDLRFRAVAGESLARRGYDAAGIVGRTLPDVAPAEVLDELQRAYTDALAGTTTVMERETVDRGAILASTVSPLVVDGTVVGGIAIVRDITERRRQEALLADAERMFEQTFVASPVGVAVVAPDGRWLKVNPALCAMLGRAEDELLNGAFQDVTHPDDLDADIALVRETLDGARDGYTMDKRYLTAAGHTLWARLTVSLIRNADTTPR